MKHFLFLTALCFLSGCSGYTYQPDNVVEEVVELGIKEELGVDVDLSPSTKETGFSPKALSPFVKK